jgi:hypothetical protein
MIDNTIIAGIKSGLHYVAIDSRKFSDNISMNEIMTKYRAAGWDVKYESDQREGDYLMFNNIRKSYDQR